jgi:transcriptional regulator with XRE-family HTH domain
MTFGERLRQLREAAGLSQEQLAKRAAISVDSVQNWEQDRTRPRLEFLPRLAQALSVTMDELLVSQAADQAQAPRGRGRPRKKNDTTPAAPPRPSGRPPKQSSGQGTPPAVRPVKPKAKGRGKGE